jgi:hypothetical protein
MKPENKKVLSIRIESSIILWLRKKAIQSESTASRMAAAILRKEHKKER